MTSGQVITAIRHEIKDEDALQYRWTDEAVFRAVTESERHLHMARPDLFLADNGTIQPVVVVADANQTMPVGEAYLLPMVWMACATLLASDGEDEANAARADGYMTRALRATLGLESN